MKSFDYSFLSMFPRGTVSLWAFILAALEHGFKIGNVDLCSVEGFSLDFQSDSGFSLPSCVFSGPKGRFRLGLEVSVVEDATADDL